MSEVAENQAVVTLEEGEVLVEGRACVFVDTDGADNYFADAVTGEFVAFALPQEFMVKDEDSCNWVLRKFLECESQINAIELSAEVLAAKAIVANAEKMRKAHYARLNWLEHRFKPELGKYAEKMLDGKKERTWKTLWGAIALTKTKGGVKVQDAVGAVAWAEENCKDAVKVEKSFLISMVPDDLKGTVEDSIVMSSESIDQLEKEGRGPCPKCGGTDRFHKDSLLDLWHCRKCEFFLDAKQVVLARKAFRYEAPGNNVTIKTGVSKA